MHTNKLSITVLSDNHAAYGLETEHGFALWIETADKKILFDTGQGAAMPHNAVALGLDMAGANLVALSHGHFDHTGNLSGVLHQASHAKLYLHPEALLDRYSIHAEPKSIGMPTASRDAVEALPHHQRHWIMGPTEMTEGVWLTGPVPRKTVFEDTGGPFFKDEQGQQTDDISDDLSLWIQTPAGLVVCLGCCHAGVINTLDFITGKADDKRIVALIGGMHLLHAKQTRLEHTADELKRYAIAHVFPCHCTGNNACDYLTERLGSMVHPGYAGMKVGF